MANFTYLPGPGDYTLMILDHGSAFATIDWERIGWNEAVRRVNLFCSAPSMLALLEKALPVIETEAHARCEAMRRNGIDLNDSVWWVEIVELKNKIKAEIDKAYGK